MVFKVEFKGRTPYDAVGDLCCWTFVLSRADGGSWQAAEQLTLGFGKGAAVQHPDTVDRCDTYELNPTMATAADGATRDIGNPDPDMVYVTVRVPTATQEVPFAFVAPCRGRIGKLHVFDQAIVDAKTSRYSKIPLLDGGSDRFVPAVAGLAAPRPDDSVALLAHYEGMKLGRLLVSFGIGPAAALPEPVAVDATAMPPAGCGCG